MCILYIMITVYNNISVKYLKSKNKQDAMYVHINRLSFILFLCLHRRSPIFCCVVVVAPLALEKKTDPKTFLRIGSHCITKQTNNLKIGNIYT